MNDDNSDNMMTIEKKFPEPEDIITHNIGLIKRIFFPLKSRFFILSNEYTITKSDYIPPYKTSANYNSDLSEIEKIPLSYTITINLTLLNSFDHPDAGDFARMNCKAKKTNIKKELNLFFGKPSDDKLDSNIKPISSILSKPKLSNRNFPNLQTEWENRNRDIFEEEIKIGTSKKSKLINSYENNETEIKKIPELWIKERMELDNEIDIFYMNLKNSINNYRKMIEDEATLKGELRNKKLDQIYDEFLIFKHKLLDDLELSYDYTITRR